MVLGMGNLIKNKHGNMELEEYKMKLLGTNRLKEVVELQQQVYDSLPNKDVLIISSYDEMLSDMEDGARIIGVMNSRDEIIAFRYITIPGKNPINLGYDINLSEDQLDRVVHLKRTIVDPKYRGNGLQSLTLEAATRMVKAEGYRHLLCTVSPYNFHSLYNVMMGGLKIKSLKKKYSSTKDGDDGLWRFVLHSDLSKKSLNPVDLVVSKWANLDKQKELIDNGYIGHEIVKDTMLLNYVKFEEINALSIS